MTPIVNVMVNQLTCLDWVSDWVLTRSTDGAIQAANQTARAALGAESLAQSEFARLAIPEHRPRLTGLLAAQSEMAEEVSMRFPDGRQVALEFHVHPEQQGGATLTARDMTLQRRLEEQLRQTQKREALGVLAGGIAHDFNNLLTGILGYAELLRLEAPPGERLHEALTVIHTAADHASRLTAQLLNVARQEQQVYAAVDVHAVVQDVIGLLRRTVDKSIRIHTSLQAPIGETVGDKGQIHQVLLNLALNARDAMPAGGSLTFRTAVSTPDPDLPLPSIPHLVIEVSDTGMGIPPELQGCIFDPFFTTKPGSGNGMGLAVVNGIIKSHKGAVRVSSQEGRGSTFTLYLPVPDEAASVRPLIAKTAQRGRGTILLIDDEEVVRKVGRRMMEGLGYRVVPYGDGRAALEYYAQQTGEINLIVLDMVMPSISGRECFTELRRLDSQVPVLLTSGYDRDAGVAEILGLNGTAFLQKPYQLAVLADVLAGLLSASRSHCANSS